MRLKFAAVFILAAMASVSQAQILPNGTPRENGQQQSREYREALRLFGKGMYGRSMVMFRDLARTTGDESAFGYYVLNAVYLEVPGYEELVADFTDRFSSSGLIPQIRYRYALNLFDDRNFNGAAEQFAMLSRHDLYRNQLPEFLFKRAYCDFEMRYFDRALLRFKDLSIRDASDYTAPAQYAIGYIYYEQENFSEAAEWLALASSDSRFSDLASFYLLECRFMLKDYETVRETGPELLGKVAEDRKPHVARFISESCLVLGDNENAVKYFELSRKSLSSESRSDFFYAGSVMYAVKDYQAAIDNFSMMTDRSDSLGQIANYDLGYSYIQTRNKVAAMEAFKDASEAVFDPAIKEDAFFNYAKLAFDLNTDSSVFYEYLDQYPKTGKREQIYSYIAIAALYNRDYEGAIAAYDEIDELDAGMKANYMKANYLRAHDLISKGSYRAAADCLRAAVYYSDRRTYFNQIARYWLGESYYKCGQYDNALKVFTDLYNTSALYGTEESELIAFNIGYSYLKKDEYASAAEWFSKYLDSDSDIYRKESLIRYGDCMFMQQKYDEAITAYGRELKDYFDADDIYPYYQAALSYGLTGDSKRKISLLSNVRQASPSSLFYPEAMYELGRSLAAAGSTDEAAECFTALADSVRDSIFIAKSYIELGMIYRNKSQDDKALSYYRKVVEEMPLSEYADAALLSIESIYKSSNRPEEYLAYIESIGRSSLKTDDEKEMMIYNAAEQIFISENYQKAIASLESYLDKYPSGRMVHEADYYMAECCRLTDRPEDACDWYRKVTDGPAGQYTGRSYLNLADLSYSLQKYDDAFMAYSVLYDNGSYDEYRQIALTGLMRSSYRARMYREAAEYAGLAAGAHGADEALLREALYVQAKSLLAVSRRDEALSLMEKLAAWPSTPEGAEASYVLIQDSYDRGAFDQAKERVYAFSDSGTGQAYWLAKAFIVLGDVFAETDNLVQAEATFRSIAEGYTPENANDDIMQSVNMRLEKLEELMNAPQGE